MEQLLTQECVFKAEYTVESIGRDFGSVFLDQQCNVAVLVVSAGWAKVWGEYLGTQDLHSIYEDSAKLCLHLR